MRTTDYDITNPKSVVWCSANNVVQTERSVFRVDFSDKNPAFRVAAKR